MKYFRQITNHSKLNIHLDFDVIILWYSQAAALPPKFCKFSSKFLGLRGWGEPGDLLGRSGSVAACIRK